MEKQEVKLFLSITVVLSAILEGVIIGTGQMYFAAFLMWTPALSAGITKYRYFPKEKNGLYFRKVKIRYIGMALVLPLLYLGVPYCIYWITNPSSMQVEWSMKLIGEGAVGILTTMVLTIGEEIGWRGFLVPRLTVLIGMKKALLVSGLIWGVWHCPLLLSGMYMQGVPKWYMVPMFLIVITAVGVIIGIVTLKSQSIWPAILMHAAHNTYDQNIFGSGTAGDMQKYFVSEAGILTAVIVVLMAIWMYRRYAQDTESDGIVIQKVGVSQECFKLPL